MKRKIFVFMLCGVMTLGLVTGCNSKPEVNKEDEENVVKYNYISNNSSNSDFEFSDTENAELAIYDKYIAKESEQILNQKIYIKIADVSTFNDESNATKEKYTAIAIDHDGNKWKIFSDFQGYIRISEENVKIYGLFRGIETTEYGNLPVLEVRALYKIDSDYLDKNEYKEISSTYIDKFNEIYSKENFTFSSIEEGVSTLDILYTNANQDIELTIEVDIDGKYVKRVTAKVVPITIKFSDVDSNFWYSVINTFNNSITIDEADRMIVTAKADAIAQADADHLILTKGQPMTTGSHIFKGTKIDINLYIRQLSVESKK